MSAVREQFYLGYSDCDQGRLVVLNYNDPLYHCRMHAEIYSPIMKRFYPITSIGLQSMAYSESSV